MTRSWRSRPISQRVEKRFSAGRKGDFVLDSDDLDLDTHADDAEPKELQQGAWERFAPARPRSAGSARVEVPLECLLVSSKRAAAKRRQQMLTDGEAFEMVENAAAVLVLEDEQDAGVDIDEWEVVSDDEVGGKRLKQRPSYSAVVRGGGR